MKITLSATNGKVTPGQHRRPDLHRGHRGLRRHDDLHRRPGAVNNALDGYELHRQSQLRRGSPVTLLANDQGNTGAGGPKSDTDTVAITRDRRE